MTIALPFEDCPVVELRRYTLHPGGFPDLMAVFERHLIAPQEESGMSVGGTFADEDDPAIFTWLRGFTDHRARPQALEAFYGGPVWARHRDAANATMIDSDDVLVLRAPQPAHRPAVAVPRGALHDRPRPERALLGIHGLAGEADTFEEWFAEAGCFALEELLGARVTAWRSDPTPNGFPRLPVRDEHVVVWLAVFEDGEARDVAAARLAADADLTLQRRTAWQHTFRLAPTVRSAHPAAEPPRRLATGSNAARPPAP